MRQNNIKGNASLVSYENIKKRKYSKQHAPTVASKIILQTRYMSRRQ
jgi:hypothetical protein